MNNCIGSEFLRDVVTYVKYACYTDDTYTHKETHGQVIERAAETLRKKIKNKLNISKATKQEAVEKLSKLQLFELSIDAMKEGNLLPSMRLMQFGGPAIERNNQRIFNCTYKEVTKIRYISDIFYMLLCGCGVGYSVRYRHINQLPTICEIFQKDEIKFTIPDTIEGWAEAARILLESYLDPEAPYVHFDYSEIRPAGQILKTTGGIAPGPEPLANALFMVREILHNKAVGSRLNSLEISDIICILAHCVLSGGNRRSALIALFDWDDELMRTSKHGDWYTKYPFRARANISAMVYIEDMQDYEAYYNFWKESFESGWGEPGIIITKSKDAKTGRNPCIEALLRDGGGCNLTEICATNIKDESDFYLLCFFSAYIGTIQASFTDFTYVDKVWSQACIEDALLGCSITGIHSSEFMMNLYYNNRDELARILRKGAEICVEINQLLAKILGINYAKRITMLKPAGSTSCIFGCSSGIHPIYAEYFIRRVRLSKLSNLYDKIKERYPSIIEDAFDNPKYDAVISIPIHMKSHVGKYTKDMDAFEQLEMARFFTEHWIKPGHVEGEDMHAVSLTVHFKPEEKDDIIKRLFELKEDLPCVSIFPYSDAKYKQQVFEEITKEEYESLVKNFEGVGQIFKNLEEHDFVGLDTSGDCDGGACEFKL